MDLAGGTLRPMAKYDIEPDQQTLLTETISMSFLLLVQFFVSCLNSFMVEAASSAIEGIQF